MPSSTSLERLSPGEQLDVTDSDHPEVDLDTVPLIESLTRRSMAWISHVNDGP
jgi:hypothetical protein